MFERTKQAVSIQGYHAHYNGFRATALAQMTLCYAHIHTYTRPLCTIAHILRANTEPVEACWGTYGWKTVHEGDMKSIPSIHLSMDISQNSHQESLTLYPRSEADGMGNISSIYDMSWRTECNIQWQIYNCMEVNAFKFKCYYVASIFIFVCFKQWRVNKTLKCYLLELTCHHDPGFVSLDHTRINLRIYKVRFFWFGKMIELKTN